MTTRPGRNVVEPRDLEVVEFRAQKSLVQPHSFGRSDTGYLQLSEDSVLLLPAIQLLLQPLLALKQQKPARLKLFGEYWIT